MAPTATIEVKARLAWTTWAAWVVVLPFVPLLLILTRPRISIDGADPERAPWHRPTRFTVESGRRTVAVFCFWSTRDPEVTLEVGPEGRAVLDYRSALLPGGNGTLAVTEGVPVRRGWHFGGRVTYEDV